MPDEPEQRYELRITATGIVRDAEGNIVSQEPVEATAVLTEAEIREQLERNQNGELR